MVGLERCERQGRLGLLWSDVNGRGWEGWCGLLWTCSRRVSTWARDSMIQYGGAGQSQGQKWCGVVGMVWSHVEVQHKVKGVRGSVSWRR